MKTYYSFKQKVEPGITDCNAVKGWIHYIDVVENNIIVGIYKYSKELKKYRSVSFAFGEGKSFPYDTILANAKEEGVKVRKMKPEEVFELFL